MAESSSQNPSSPNITLKEELDTQERPESPNPFLPADQVEFMFDQITFSTNNKVALLYPLHSNSEYFVIVSDFISKCCLKEAFTRAPNQYVEYLVEFWYTAKNLEDSKIWVSTPTRGIRGEIGITTFRNALRAHYLPYSSQYVTPPSLVVVRPWFATIGYSREIRTKVTIKKSFLPPRWRLLIAQIIQCLGSMPGAKTGPRRKYAKHNPGSKMEATKSQPPSKEAAHSPMSHSKRRKRFGTDKDKEPNQPLVSTPVDTELHKEDLQAAGDPTSLGVASKEGAHPHLSNGMSAYNHNETVFSASTTFHSESASGYDALVDSTAKVNPVFYAPNDSIPQQ
ncbi:hypothetical protein Tco_0465097 [Tanacetum coccineum]